MLALHGNWVDLVLIIFLLFYSYQGTKRGFLVLVAEMVSFVVSFILALHFYSWAANFLTSNFSLTHSLANAIGFIFIALVSEFSLASLFTKVYKNLPERLFHSSFNHVFGLIPAAIDGLILSAFVLSIIIVIPFSPPLKFEILSSKLGSQLISKTSTVEHSLNEVFGAAIEDSLSFLTVKTGSTQTIDLHFHFTNGQIDPSSETEMLKLINNERTAHNLSVLQMRSPLRTLARSHSQDMLERGYFSHVNPDGNDPFDRMKSFGIDYQTAGENLAYAPNVKIAHDGLMNSTGHRANILNPEFHLVGIGVVDAGVYGKMFTQEFTN